MNFYETIGVPQTATAEEIGAAFRRAARDAHPDRNPNGAQRMKELSEAYATLSDPEKRAKYDRELRAGGKREASGHTDGQAGAYWAEGLDNEEIFDKVVEDLVGIKNASGFAKTAFDAYRQAHAQRQAERAEMHAAQARQARAALDVSIAKAFPLEALYKGIGIKLKLNVEAPCECGGRTKGRCPDCGGAGFTRTKHGFTTYTRQCHCGGRPPEACENCDGSGTTSRREEITCKVPPRTSPGTRLRLSGRGKIGDNGRGDLFITINLKEPSTSPWSRDPHSGDLRRTVSVPALLAMRGDTVTTVGPGGDRVSFHIPSGTIAGAEIRIAGMGLDYKSVRGDLIIDIETEAVKGVSDRARRLMEELEQELSGQKAQEGKS